VRKLALLVAAVVSLAAAATAYAVTDTVTYKVSISPSKAGHKPGLTYKATTSVHGPGGTQPDGVSELDVFFARQFRNNGAAFPSPCKQSDIDGKTAIPHKCNKALIGSGTATANAGTAGSSSLGSENLTVKLFNASHGKSVLLVVNGTSPFAIHNRVIVGKVKRLAHGKFGYEDVFVVPQSLQTIPGTAIPSVITDSTLSIGRTFHHIGYAQLTGCPRSKKLAAKLTYKFTNGTSSTGTATIACKR